MNVNVGQSLKKNSNKKKIVILIRIYITFNFVHSTSHKDGLSMFRRELLFMIHFFFKGMGAAMKSMNLEKISTLMDKFEKEFEDLDVQTSVMEGAMSQTTATNIPQDSVEQLMKQVQ